MKPFKSGKGIANWLLRIGLIAILYNLYSNILSTWTISNPSFLIAMVIMIFGILLIIGGVLSKPGMTIISGISIAIISIYKIIITFNGSFNQYLIAQVLPLAIGFYFFSNGNDN